MKEKMKPNNRYTIQKDVDMALNNAVATVLNSASMREVSDTRKRQLRTYLSGMLDAIFEHRKEGYLTAEELVFILVAGALFVQKLLISKNKKSPLFEDIASEIAKDLEKNDQ